jgi:hypothetical protein
MSDKKLVPFVDSIGRTLVGEVVKDNKQTLTVKNPAILHVQPNQQTGQISVQLVPFFFKEFQSGGGDSVWSFNKATITLADKMSLDERLTSQYVNMFSVIQTPAAPQLATAGAPAAGGEPPVVKLFDD